jgi:hypothetical protein
MRFFSRKKAVVSMFALRAEQAIFLSAAPQFRGTQKKDPLVSAVLGAKTSARPLHSVF